MGGSRSRALTYSSSSLGPICAFTVVFSEPIIRIGLYNDHRGIGTRATAGILTLRLLAVWVIFSTFASLQNLLLLATGKPSIAARNAILGSIALIGLDLLLIPNDLRFLGLPLAGLGVTGAALATLASAIVLWLSVKWANHRHLGYREQSGSLRHFISAGIL